MTARLLLVLPVIALLAACTTGGGGGGGSTDGGGGSGGDGGSGGGGDCSSFDAEFAPFTSDLIAAQTGTVWGDGSTFEVQLSQEAIDGGVTPYVDFLSNVNGPAQVASSQIMDDLGGGKYSNSLNLFDSQFDGQAGIAQVTGLANVTFDGEKYDGDKIALGNYCVMLEVAE